MSKNFNMDGVLTCTTLEFSLVLTLQNGLNLSNNNSYHNNKNTYATYVFTIILYIIFIIYQVHIFIIPFKSAFEI